MEYIKLGNTGLNVSRLCIGTMTFGLQTNREDAFRILDEAKAVGINFIDTANVYPIGRTSYNEAGLTEVIIGEWLQTQNREDFVIVSKCFGTMGPDLTDKGLSRAAILKAVDASLERLQTTYIDLYLAHQFDDDIDYLETLSAFNELIQSGKVKHIGISNWRSWQIMKANGLALANKLIPYTVIEPRYNLLFRMIEDDLLPMAIEENMAVITYNPLAAGLLTGKYTSNRETIEGTRFALGGATSTLYQERYWQKAQFEAVDAYRAWCAEQGLEMIPTALKWVLQQKGISSVIIGASRVQQLADSLKVVNMQDLTQSQLEWLNNLWYSLPRRNEYR
jgi:aryl-alcohol dehydrogenase (NADP+)